MNFLAPRVLTGVTTQGRAGVPSYVKTYKVSYSTDGFTWNQYQENGVDKVGFNSNKVLFLLLWDFYYEWREDPPNKLAGG